MRYALGYLHFIISKMEFHLDQPIMSQLVEAQTFTTWPIPKLLWANQLKLVLDLGIPEECKAELT